MQKDKILQSTLLFKFINMMLFSKNRIHVYWLTASLQLNKAATSLNTETDKTNLHMRNSLNLQTALADLEGGVPGTRPPKGPDSFVLTYKIFET